MITKKAPEFQPNPKSEKNSRKSIDKKILALSGIQIRLFKDLTCKDGVLISE